MNIYLNNSEPLLLVEPAIGSYDVIQVVLGFQRRHLEAILLVVQKLFQHLAESVGALRKEEPRSLGL